MSALRSGEGEGRASVEREHLTRAGSAVRSEVLLPQELARCSRGSLEEGSVSRPGPQQAEASESLRTAGARRASSTSYVRGLTASQEPLLYHFRVYL